MTHRSRLAGFIIDCQDTPAADSARFWAAALGLQAEPARAEGDAEYADLTGAPAGLNVEVQRVDHPSRVHLDIESDDIDAEAERLEKLGARRVGFVKRWWVMEAPTGHRFCIVRMRDHDARPTSGHSQKGNGSRCSRPLSISAPGPRSAPAVTVPSHPVPCTRPPR